MMIMYASQSFVKRLGCAVSLPNQKPVQGRAMDAWSGDMLKVYRIGEVAVMMHDASLTTLIIPMKGARSFEEFLLVFLRRVSEMLGSLGRIFDPANQTWWCYVETTAASSDQ